jgi:hypothetical protein
MIAIDIERVRESIRSWLEGMPHLKPYIDPGQVTAVHDLVQVCIQFTQDGGRLHASDLIDLAARLEAQYPCAVRLQVTVERPTGEPDFPWPRED